jgi:hypothetical protein
MTLVLSTRSMSKCNVSTIKTGLSGFIQITYFRRFLWNQV